MSQYKLAASAQANQLQSQSQAFSQAVKRYIQRADNCLLAVVLFAASLFFAGISTRLQPRRAQAAILCLGYLLFAGALIWIATFPMNVAV